MTAPDTNAHARKELKALDREIPWREILARDPETIRAFIQAVHKEADSWEKYESVRSLSEVEIGKLLKDPRLRRRIMKSRACYRDTGNHH